MTPESSLGRIEEVLKRFLPAIAPNYAADFAAVRTAIRAPLVSVEEREPDDGLQSLVAASRKYHSLVFIAGQDEGGRDLYGVAAATDPEQIAALRKLSTDGAPVALEEERERHARIVNTHRGELTIAGHPIRLDTSVPPGEIRLSYEPEERERAMAKKIAALFIRPDSLNDGYWTERVLEVLRSEPRLQGDGK